MAIQEKALEILRRGLPGFRETRPSAPMGEGTSSTARISSLCGLRELGVNDVGDGAVPATRAGSRPRCPENPQTRMSAPTETIPARMLNEFVYCQRLFYYEFVEGVFIESADTLRGEALHKRVDSGTGALPAASGKSKIQNPKSKMDQSLVTCVSYRRDNSLPLRADGFRAARGGRQDGSGRIQSGP